MMFSFMIIWENGKEIKGLDNYELYEIIYNGCYDGWKDVFDELLETGSCEYFDHEYGMKATAIICAESTPKKKVKVFSTYLYMNDMLKALHENKLKYTTQDEIIYNALYGWCLKCEGLTKDEIDILGFKIDDDWLKEMEK